MKFRNLLRGVGSILNIMPPWCRRRRRQRAILLRWGLAGDRALRAIWDKMEAELE